MPSFRMLSPFRRDKRILDSVLAGVRLRRSMGLWALAVLSFSALPVRAGEALWTGFYAGLQAGGAWGTGDTSVGCIEAPLAGVCAPIISTGALPTHLSTNLDGFVGGGQAGYNFQTGNLVYGFEADISWTNIDDETSRTTSGLPISPQTFVTTLGQDLNWLATARGRLGFAMHDWLLYATGGLAFGDVEHNYSFIASGGDAAITSNSKVQTGWTAGGGGEYSFGHWSVKGEYLYYDLGDETLDAVGVQASGAPPDTTFQPDFKTKGHIVRAGVNFPLQ